MTAKQAIDVHAFKEALDLSRNNQSVDFINVCTPVEYKEQHITGVRCVPLDQIDQHIDDFKDKKQIYIHCRSGSRGAQAAQALAEAGVTAELINMEGGLMAWKDAGLPVQSKTSTKLPLMRQVMLTAGSLVLLGVVLAQLVHPYFLALTVFVGAGLVFSGSTGWCGMAYALAKMPWNK